MPTVFMVDDRFHFGEVSSTDGADAALVGNDPIEVLKADAVGFDQPLFTIPSL